MIFHGGKMTTKRDRFVKIAEARTNKIIDMVRLLGNCSNKMAYEYDDREVTKIFAAIDKELRVAKTRFSIEDNESNKFKL
jgi:hypothetical protein